MPAVRITNDFSTAVPSNGATDRAVTAGATASALIVAALVDVTRAIYWTITGANARVTFDGSDPTATNGHQIAAGSSGVWSKTMASKARIIREDGTDAVFHITEIDYL